MTVIEFPRKKAKQSFNNSISEKEKQTILDEFATILNEDQSPEPIDFKNINNQLFRTYVREFPCFKNYKQKITLDDLFDAYECGRLNESQEVAFLSIVEMVSDYEFGVSLKELMESFGSDDFAAFIRILSAHSLLLKTEVTL